MAWSMKGYRGDPGRQGEQVRLVTIHYLLFYCLGCYVACRVTRQILGDARGTSKSIYFTLLVYSFLGCKVACRITGKILGDARGHLPLSRVNNSIFCIII